MCHQKRGQIGGRDSLGDCDNICEGNLVFRVIFGKFMHRWFQICAQLGSYNVSFSHYRPLKLKYDFLGGSFSRLTSQSQAGTLSRFGEFYMMATLDGDACDNDGDLGQEGDENPKEKGAGAGKVFQTIFSKAYMHSAQ